MNPIEKSKSSEKVTKKYPSFRDNVTKYFSFYSKNTGMHGCVYIGEQDRSHIEKFCWLIFFCVCLYFSIFLIFEQWYKWVNYPVLVSFAQSPTPVWQIPFPAITICPKTSLKKSKFDFSVYRQKYQAHLQGTEKLTDEEIKNFTNSALLCDLENEEFSTMANYSDPDVTDFLIWLAPKWFDLLFSCFFVYTNVSCPEHFLPIITEEGICFTSNLLDNSDLFTDNYFQTIRSPDFPKLSESWSLENGYSPSAEVITYPQRVVTAGTRGGLYIVLTSVISDLDFSCRDPVDGFKVLLHNPAEIPTIGSHYLRVPCNGESVINIKPTMMTTSEGLRGYSAEQRQCFFTGEKVLYFFKVYTQKNCHVECLTNYTLAMCECVPFYMPHEVGAKICGPGRIPCVKEAENEFMAQQVLSGLWQQKKSDESASFLTSNCNCLPACTTLAYNMEITQGEFSFHEMLEAFHENLSQVVDLQMTRLTLFFKEPQFITSQRNELYGLTGFLASCGGILGLFIGFSFLSLVEIVYFLSLRLFCNVRKYGKHFWSGDPELLKNDAYLH